MSEKKVNIDSHFNKMRRAITEIDDPIDALFFQAHFAGMEQLGDLQKRWQTASPEDKIALAEQIVALRTKLMESLEVLKS